MAIKCIEARRPLSILLLLPLVAAGCGVLVSATPPCRQVVRSPVEAYLYLSGPPGSDRSLGLHLHENGGLEIQFVPWTADCAQLTDAEIESWRRNIAVLVRELDADLPPSPGETVGVAFGGSARQSVAAPITGLPAESVEALRQLTCTAFHHFGRHARQGVLGATPELAALVGFPVSCRSGEPVASSPLE